MSPRPAKVSSVSVPGFRGFRPEAFDFFRRLSANNRKSWFDENRHVYDEHVVGVLRGLCEELAPALLQLDPQFEVSGRTGKNLSRINRDIRFARDKTPYRHNLYLFFGERGRPSREARLYLGLSADAVTCGFAVYHLPRGRMERLLKARRARDPEPVERFLRRRARRYEMYWHGTERGEWKKYPGAPRTEPDWKRCKAWVVRKLFPSTHARISSPRFAGTVLQIFRDLYPLYGFAALEGRSHERLRAT